MKNLKVHILPTKEASHVIRYRSVLQFTDKPLKKSNPQHFYLTSDEEIKEGDWVIHKDSSNPLNVNGVIHPNQFDDTWRKIVATTDKLEINRTDNSIKGHAEVIIEYLPSISIEDIPKIIELWNRGVKEVQVGVKQVKLFAEDPIEVLRLEQQGRSEEEITMNRDDWYEYKLNDDGSIKLVWCPIGESRRKWKKFNKENPEAVEDFWNGSEDVTVMYEQKLTPEEADKLDNIGVGMKMYTQKEVNKLLNALIAARSMMLDNLQYNEESVPVVGIDKLISKYKE